MDELLKRTADAGVAVGEAETALDEDDPGTARAALESAEEQLTALRERWPGMNAAEKALVGRAAATVRERLDAAKARLPQRVALSEGAPEPEDDGPPEDEGAPPPVTPPL